MHRIAEVPIVVAGSGRSGTTWIGNTLAAAARAFSIFEPLAPFGVATPDDEGVRGSPGTYLPPDGDFPEWAQLWSDIFSGKATNSWTRQDWRYVPQQLERWKQAERVAYRLVGLRHSFQVRCARRPLVKAIYTNLMLPWLARTHPLRVVYVVRHPCAVVGSRLRLGWPHQLDQLFAQPRLMQDCLAPYERMLRDAASPVERMAVLWCVENLVPLRNWRPNWILACYEHLTTAPAVEFERLMRLLELPDLNAGRRAAARLATTHGPSARKVTPWHGELSRAEGERVLQVCREFGLDFYGHSFAPNRSPIVPVRRTVPELSRVSIPA